MLTPVFYVVLRNLAGGKVHVANKDSPPSSEAPSYQSSSGDV